MDEMISEFYVTLPSNSSMNYFPQNTQASFRTKLARPIVLSGIWEVGLSEIFIPRTSFNIGKHNNRYSITYEETVLKEENYLKYRVPFVVKHGTSEEDVINMINKNIEEKCGAQVNFTLDNAKQNVNIHIARDYELHIFSNEAPEILSMLKLPKIDRIIKTSESFGFKNPHRTKESNFFNVIHNYPKRHFIIRITNSSYRYTDMNILHLELIQHINHNLSLTGIRGAADFYYDFKENKVQITVEENVEIEFRLEYASQFMKMLSMSNNTILKGKTFHDVQRIDNVPFNEYIRVSIKDTSLVSQKNKKTEHLALDVGWYKNSKELFSAFKHLDFKLLANNKVKLFAPPSSSVSFQDGLKDLLGFKSSFMNEGTRIADYPIELDGGITEIYVYTDIIESHSVGDTIAPLLRVIPVFSTRADQIVINYQRPLYFPLRNNYLDSIEIELKSSTGSDIIFTSGKTLLVLSFRRREI